MAGSDGAAEAGLDIGAILDRALEAAKPKVRRATKTEQLREQRAKIAALQAKNYTLNEIAAMVGVSKDTLRNALKPKKKKTKMAANGAKPKEALANGHETIVKTRPVEAKIVPPGRKRKFPSNDDL